VRLCILYCLAGWNLETKSGMWTIQRALELLQFTYDIDSFFSLVVVKDVKNIKEDTNIIQV